MNTEIYKLWSYILKSAERHASLKIGLMLLADVMIYQLGKSAGEAFYYILHWCVKRDGMWLCPSFSNAIQIIADKYCCELQ